MLALPDFKTVSTCNIVSPTHQLLYPQAISLVLIYVGGWVNPRATVCLEGLCQCKIPIIPSGIEPATFQLVTQRPTHLHHRMPQQLVNTVNIYPDIGALIITIQANKFTQNMYMFQALLAHHQGARQVVQNDHLVQWCLVCRTAKNSSM